MAAWPVFRSDRGGVTGMAKQSRRSLKMPDSKHYDVGHGKPPQAQRFKPGVSGNPRGRPRGSRNKPKSTAGQELAEIIMAEAYRSVKINDGPKVVAMPIAQAVIRATALAAAKGQHRAQRLFTELLGATERERYRLNSEWLDVAINYKVEWERELERRARFNIIDLPPPLPHPDHVVIDIRKGTASIRGPATREEKAQWDDLAARKADFELELRELEAELPDAEGKHRAIVETEIERTRKVIKIIENGMC
jgi:hypothetical protein